MGTGVPILMGSPFLRDTGLELFCVSGVGYPLPKRGFAMATKTCRAAKLYQRPLNSMRSLSVLK